MSMPTPTPIPTPHTQTFFDDATFTATHVVWCPASRAAAVIDSVLDYDPKSGRTATASADRVLGHIRSLGLSVQWHLETHAHADHFSAAPYLKEQLGGRIAIGARICEVQAVFRQIFNATDMATDGTPFDHLFDDGETFRIGELDARVIHTPGHTPACATYVVGGDAFVGDTLFMPDYGSARCDFPGGDARTLYRSIAKVLALPASTRLHLCHDYLPGGREAAWQSTVAQQRAHNIHVHEGVSEDEFVAMRTARDKTLEMPALMLPAVQVNARAGHFPPPESNGTRYLKIPLNVF
jgi:glyoxylase-like metal-dependent hydrolase (beta-lactamase superfamily II)